MPQPADLAGTHGGSDARAQNGRLAAARCADDREQPAGREPPDDLRRDLFAAEEEGAVIGLEREQTLVRAPARRRRARSRGFHRTSRTCGRYA